MAVYLQRLPRPVWATVMTDMKHAKNGGPTDRPASTVPAATIEAPGGHPVLTLDDETWDAFVEAFDAPVNPDPSLKARFARRPQWLRRSRLNPLSIGFEVWVCRGHDDVIGLWTPDAGERRPDRQSGGLPAPEFWDVPIWMCSESASSWGPKPPSSRLRQTQYSTPINILSWRVFWLTMLNRVEPDLEPALVLTELETNIPDHLIPNPTADPSPAKTLSLYLIKIARLSGYLARAKDPPPDNIVMWRGVSRLNDIAPGATLQTDFVGN